MYPPVRRGKRLLLSVSWAQGYPTGEPAGSGDRFGVKAPTGHAADRRGVGNAANFAALPIGMGEAGRAVL
jgi:hypothetical protein